MIFRLSRLGVVILRFTYVHWYWFNNSNKHWWRQIKTNYFTNFPRLGWTKHTNMDMALIFVCLHLIKDTQALMISKILYSMNQSTLYLVMYLFPDSFMSTRPALVLVSSGCMGTAVCSHGTRSWCGHRQLIDTISVSVTASSQPMAAHMMQPINKQIHIVMQFYDHIYSVCV